MGKVHNIQEKMTKECKVSQKIIKRTARNKKKKQIKNAFHRFINELKRLRKVSVVLKVGQ